jgi:hypothetical protein
MIFSVNLSGVRLSPFGTAATFGLLYQPLIIYDGDCGAIGGIKISKGKGSTWRKPVQVPLCPPQIPHDLTRARTLAAAVGSQRLTASAMADLKANVTRAQKTADAALPSKSVDVKQIATRVLYISRIVKSVFGEASSF